MKSLEPVRCLLATFAVLMLATPLTIWGEPVQDDEDAAVSSSPEGETRFIYDQRQNGKYNIHVSIKDVALIEMGQNEVEDLSYSEDDYYYDEGDLTVKPIKLSTEGTTTARANSTRTTSKTSSIATAADDTTMTSATSNPTAATAPINPMNVSRPTLRLSPNLLADIAATYSGGTNHPTAPSSPKIASTTPPSTPIYNKTPTVTILHSGGPSTHPPGLAAPPPSFTELMARSATKAIQTLLNTRPEQLVNPKSAYNVIRSAQPAPAPPSMARTYMQTLEQPDELQAPQLLAREAPGDSRIYKFKVRRTHKQVSSPSANGIETANNDDNQHQQQQHQHRQQHQPLYANRLKHLHARRCRAYQYRDAGGNCRIKRSSSLLRKLFNMLILLPFANEQQNQDYDEVE